MHCLCIVSAQTRQFTNVGRSPPMHFLFKPSCSLIVWFHDVHDWSTCVAHCVRQVQFHKLTSASALCYYEHWLVIRGDIAVPLLLLLLKWGGPCLVLRVVNWTLLVMTQSLIEWLKKNNNIKWAVMICFALSWAWVNNTKEKKKSEINVKWRYRFRSRLHWPLVVDSQSICCRH